MKNFSYSGQSISFVATEPLVSGQMYCLGSAFGVVSNSLFPGQAGELFLTGVWELLKDTTEIKIGDKLYFDGKTLTTYKKPDPLPVNLKCVGMAAESKDASKSTILCRLNGVSV